MDKSIKDKTADSIKMSDNERAFVEYCIKKAEKISGAIYVLSNFIPSTDPMRHSIRKSSLRLLSDIFSIGDMSDMNSGTRAIVFGVTSAVIPELVSLINISRTSGFISEMNASVLERELNYFQKTLEERFDLNTALLLSKNDFYVPAIEESKARVGETYKSSVRTPVQSINTTTSNTPKKPKTEKVASKKSERRSTILSLLKDNKEIGVKDAALKLPSYSEKTIQRELIKMVEEGILNKDGDRRWSKYSLA